MLSAALLALCTACVATMGDGNSSPPPLSTRQPGFRLRLLGFAEPIAIREIATPEGAANGAAKRRTLVEPRQHFGAGDGLPAAEGSLWGPKQCLSWSDEYARAEALGDGSLNFLARPDSWR